MNTIPSFSGFNTAQRGLMVAQMGLNLVNHNISNANVEGFTRQRMDIETMNSVMNPGQLPLGQGATVQAITQLRNSFLDTQFRKESSIKGETSSTYTALSQAELVLGEPSFTGLANSVQDLFNSISDMKNNPQSLPARTAFIQKNNALLTLFKQQGQQLLDIHKNLVGNSTPSTWDSSQLGLKVKDINERVATIADLNRQIAVVTASGVVPNDLIDKRNLQLEKLSKLVDLDVTDSPNQQVSLKIGGQDILKGAKVLDTLQLVASTSPNSDRIPARLTTTTGGVDITDTIASGEIKGILDVAGNKTSIKNIYNTFESLSTLAETLATEFNALQSTGRDLNGALHSADAYSNIYNTGSGWTAGPKLMYLSVNTSFQNNADKIALAENDTTVPGNFTGVGDSRNATKMAALKTATFAGLNGTTFEGFHQNIVSALGSDTNSADNRNQSQADLLSQLDATRQSVSGVNIDEEGLDLIKFQRMFEASSRIVQTYSQIYQNIIAMLG